MTTPLTPGVHQTATVHHFLPKEKQSGGSSTTEDIPRAPEFSDDTLALRFTDAHLADLRYVQKWGK